MSRITMYSAVNNSPQTSLSANIAASDTTITLLDASVLPDAPNLCTIGTGEDAEVVLFTAKNGNVISGCTRGFYGTTAKAWAAITAVYRGFTAYDHDSFKGNLDQMYLKDDVDGLFAATFRGGETYYDTMRAFFQANGCAIRADLTEIVERWYSLGRLGWEGGVKFPLTTLSSGSTGTKTGDNASLSCTPSTNETANTDDYALMPLFAVIDCNWQLDSNGKKVITAIKDIPSLNPFVTDDPLKPVGVLQMTPWLKCYEDEEYYYEIITDIAQKPGFYPAPEAKDLDGTVHSFVLHAKYGFGDDWSSISGVPIRVWDVSHNGQITPVRNKFSNNYYCGKTSADDAWMKLMCHIKYASLTLDGIMNGCNSYYNNNKKIAVAETGVRRIIVAAADGAGLLVGSTICVGTSSYGSKTNQCSVVDRRKIVSLEDVEIEGTTYKAVNLDLDADIDTTTDLYWTTMQWYTGSTDNVKGNDGSPYSCTSNKEPYKLQGIEQSYGCYEVIADTILKYETEDNVTNLNMYICRDASKITTSANSDYNKVGYSCPAEGSSDAWSYIKRLGFDPEYPEIWFPEEIGGSSSTYTKDALYIKKAGTSGSFEWLALGLLDRGLSGTGLSCGLATYGLSVAVWVVGGRLSANGSRGEFAA